MQRRQRRRRASERRARAEPQAVCGFLDRVEPRDAAEPDDLLGIAQLLGDPQADVGRAANEDRVGIAGIEIGERRLARRRGEERALLADEKIAPVRKRSERGAALGRLRLEAVGGRAVAGRQRRVDDRLVAGAAAEVARQRLADASIGRGLALVVEREQAHDDSRRAEAALRAVEIDHRLLDRVQRVAVGEILDRQHFRAVDLPQQQNAGVDGLISERAVAQARQHNGAGAAIALGAAFLRSLRPRLLAQPVEQRRARRKRSKRDSFGRESGRSGCGAPRPTTLWNPSSGSPLRPDIMTSCRRERKPRLRRLRAKDLWRFSGDELRAPASARTCSSPTY